MSCSMKKRLQAPSVSLGKARNIRVGINVSNFLDANTGVERYTSDLCKSILKTDGKNNYFWVLTRIDYNKVP